MTETYWTNQMEGFGMATAVSGAVTQSIGAYYEAKAAQLQFKSKASSLRFQQQMSEINASVAREDAGSILKAGHHAKATMTMRAGMEMARQLSRQGARGITIGEGSAAEAMASDELIKDIDAYTIDSNALRQAQARETQALNLETQGLMQGVSAQNLMASAGSISPGAAFGTSLIGGASRVAGDIGNIMRYRYGS
tara:strand:+ start:494 stop:1078 length:585 start_codon:yes stop_codon:yes gene_type:complete